MASTFLEASRGNREEAKVAENGKAAEAKADAPAPSSGGFKAWLPLAAAVVLMPALAYATTLYVLLPKLERGLAQGKPGVAQASAAEPGPAAPTEGKAAVS